MIYIKYGANWYIGWGFYSFMARFTPEILQQIRDRLSLTDVVSRHVNGIKYKNRELWSCCPFHNEKSASFHVKEEKGYYHCFGCGAHGNIFDFVQEVQGGSFVEVVEELAELSGIQLPKDNYDPKLEAVRNDGLAALSSAAKYYSKNFSDEAANYLKRRGISGEIAKEFSLGFSNDSWTDTSDNLVQQGFKASILLETGITTKSDKGKSNYDRFRGRIMFPIESLKGEVIGFGGRVLDGAEPKYLNSPETPFFNKRYNLYNLNRAKEFIRKENRALVVEGYMDVIGLWKYGIKTAVAPMGTAITESQVQLLWRYHDCPTVCMDGDEAGRNAATRVAKRVLNVIQPGKTLRFAWMSEGEDPDSFVQKHGEDEFNKLLENCSSLEDVLWADITENQDINSGDSRAIVDSNIKNLVKLIDNETVRINYQKSLKDRLWGNKKQQAKAEVSQKPASNREEKARILLSILFRKPELLESVQEKFSTLSFEKQEYKELQNTLFRFFLNQGVEKQSLDTYLGSIGILESVTVMLKSDVVEKIADDANSDLENYWLKVYADYTAVNRSNIRSHYRNALNDFASSPQEAWERLKQLQS